MKVLAFLLLPVTSVLSDYWSDRNSIISAELTEMLGSDLVLTPTEETANNILMGHKLLEYDTGFNNPKSFNPSQHFFNAKSSIEESMVFKIIKMLPKGCSLHSHDTATPSGDFLYLLTYTEKLYACTAGNRLSFQFFDQPDTTCNWELVSVLRATNTSFDPWLKSQIGIVVEDPIEAYPDIDTIWAAFEEVFNVLKGLITYRPVWISVMTRILEELYLDNIMYTELRSGFSGIYDLGGINYDSKYMAELFIQIVNDFKATHPGFQGAKIIYAKYRGVDIPTVDTYVQNAIDLHQAFSSLVVGFDLVGQEDKGKPLNMFIDQLIRVKSAGLSLYCHAGETNWYGTTTDYNLVDAVLLNCTRIGHGFALVKHPEVLRQVKAKNIAIEVNPISNQVLKLVADLRNHPGSYFIANGYPIVITNDDPGFWGSVGLSYDWYLAYMGMASREADLKLLKKLALDSFNYTGMNESERLNAINQWKESWDLFIQNVILGKY